jgi:hypothetical protein
MAKQGQAQVEDQPCHLSTEEAYISDYGELFHLMMMMMMMTVMVIETSVQYIHLTRLIAREDYIKFTRRESTKTYSRHSSFNASSSSEIHQVIFAVTATYL